MYCEKAVANLLKARYEIKESLGQGGMGVVYQAYDEVLKCNVAVKMIRDTPDPMALQLFRRECEVLTGLNHPNIVPDPGYGRVRAGRADAAVLRDAAAARRNSRSHHQGRRAIDDSAFGRRPDAGLPRLAARRTRRAWSIATSSRATSS